MPHTPPTRTEPIQEHRWGTSSTNEEVLRFRMSNTEGMTLELCNVGACIVSCTLPDGTDVIVGDKSSPFFPQKPPAPPYFGATIGRLAGRTATTPFTWRDTTYTLAPNEGASVHLHGGTASFAHAVWATQKIETKDKLGVEFSYRSPHLEEGYPGEVHVYTTISVLKYENTIDIAYRATSDTPSPINLTNHSYFNLGDTTIRDNLLQIHSKKVYVLNSHGLTTGATKDVQDTPFDFTHKSVLAPRIDTLKNDRNGLDHVWAIKDTAHNHAGEKDLTHIATLESPTGKSMDTHSTASALVCYTGNFLDLYTQGERPYRKYEAICFEAQHAPGFLHNSTMPTSMIDPKLGWSAHTRYTFSI